MKLLTKKILASTLSLLMTVGSVSPTHIFAEEGDYSAETTGDTEEAVYIAEEQGESDPAEEIDETTIEYDGEVSDVKLKQTIVTAESAADFAGALSQFTGDPSNRLIITGDDYFAEAIAEMDYYAIRYGETVVVEFVSESDKEAAKEMLASAIGDEKVTDEIIFNVDTDDEQSEHEPTLIFGADEPLPESKLRSIADEDDRKIIAVIDTGIGNGLADESVDITGESVYDENGHGTIMADIIRDVAEEDVLILSIKAFDEYGRSTTSLMTAAVLYAIEAGADYINISASADDTDEDDAFENAVQKALDAGITVIASAGNEQENASSLIPANIEGVITATTADEDNMISGGYGDSVDYAVKAGSSSEAAAAVSAYVAIDGLDEQLGKTVFELENDGTTVKEVEIVENIDPEAVYEFNDETTGIVVSITGAAMPEGAVKDDISLSVEKLENTDEVRGYFDEEANVELYSIDFFHNGEVFEPDGIVSVSVPVSDKFEVPYVYHFVNDDLIDMHATVEDEYAVFTTTHFSYYVVSDRERKAEEVDIVAEEPEVEDAEEAKTFSNDLPVVSLDDLAWYIQAGGSAVGFIGSESDEKYQELLSYYNDIYDVADDEKKMAFQVVDPVSVYEGGEKELISSAYDVADQEKIKAAINDVLEGTTGHSVVIYSFNTNIIKVSTIPANIPEETSLETAAHIDFSSTYQPSVTIPRKGQLMMSAKRISEAAYPEGYVWNLYAKSQIQPFTAEMSGTYKIELWGADGDTDTNYPDTASAGIGGQGGYTTAEMHLNKGETVYFGLGFRNGFSDKRSWNGGGAGWGLWANFSAGGGGAAAMYSQDIHGSATSPSTTELSGYSGNRDKVLLVAGGGGGAENYFHPGRYPYPCDDGHCVVAYGGGGGGTSGSKGSATKAITLGNPGTQTSGYAFGQGQDYPTSSYDASTGAGGGGWYGGFAVPNIRYVSGSGNNALQGGAGGGGSGYINTSYVDSSGKTLQNASMKTGGHVNFNLTTGEDDGQHARARITFQRSDEYTLTVQYLQKGTETVLHEQNSYKLKKGAAVNIPVYYLSGYTVTGDYIYDPASLTETTSGVTSTFPTSDYFDMDELISEAGRDADEHITGTMPAANIVLKIYYDYPLLRVRYLDYETKNKPNPTQLAETYEAHIQPGQTYDVLSPVITGYMHDVGNYQTYNVNNDLTVDKTEMISGTKTNRNEYYTVYYVQKVKPNKNITEKNGMPVSAAMSAKGVQLMANDEYTYSISWENKLHAERVITIVDHLPDNIDAIEGTISNDGVYDETEKTITWTINAPARTSAPGGRGSMGNVTFRAKVKSTVTNGTVDNEVGSNDCTDDGSIGSCVVRKDPIVHYSIVKSADPVSGSDVSFDQVVTYYIDVTNDGNATINNLAVVDYIPEHMGDLSDEMGRYPSANHDYHGEYDSDGNYVHYLIDELPVGAVARLSFQTAVTAKQESTDRLEIINFAYHGVLPINNPTERDRMKVVNPDGDDSTDDGKKTNTVVHYAIGPKVEAIKSSDPVSGTKVNNGQRITYTVDLANTGTVNTNWVRLADQIPEGTTYVPNSLSLIAENNDSNNKYAWMSGSGFDVHYDFGTKQYRLENIATANDINRITVTWPSGLSIVSGTYSGTVSGNTLTYDATSAISAAAQKTFLERIRWSGNYTATGSINVKFIKRESQTTDVTYTKPGTYYVDLPATNNQAQSYTITAKGGQGGGGSATTQAAKTVSVANGGRVTIVVGKGGAAPKTNYVTKSKSLYIETGEGTSGSVRTKNSAKFTGTVTKLYELHGAHAWWGAGATAKYTLKLINGDGRTLYTWSGTGSTRMNGNGTLSNLKYAVTNGYLQVSVQYGGDSWIDGEVTYSYQEPQKVAGGNGTASSVTTPNGSVSSAGTNGTTNGTTAGKDGSASIKGTASWTTEVKTSTSAIPNSGDSKGCKYIPAGSTVGGKKVSRAYVECLTSDLQPGKTAKMTFAVTVNNNAASIYDEIDNVALYETKFTVDNSYAGTNPNLPTTETNMTVHPLGDVALSAVKDSTPVSGSTINRGDTITYRIKLTNSGTKAAKYVHVRDYIPAETTYAGSITDGGVYVAGSANSGNYVEWMLNIPAGGSKTVSFNVKANDDAKLNYRIINEALYELKAENPGPIGTIKDDPANKTNQVYHLIHDDLPPAVHDITVAKHGVVSNPIGSPSTGHAWEETAPTDRSYAGHDSLITYTLRVVNSSEETAAFTRVRDFIPDGTEFVPDSFETINSPTSARFSPDISETHAYIEQGKYAEWIVYNLGGGDYIDLAYTVKIGKYTVLPAEGDRAENVVHNTAYYQEELENPGEPGSIADNPAYETNEVRTPLVDPHVKIVDIADPATVNVADGATEVKRRQIITYTLNVTNDTDIFLNYAVVESNIPQNTSYIENSIQTIDQNDVKLYDAASKTARYIVKDLAPGETKQVSYQVQVSDVTPLAAQIIDYALVKGYITDPGLPEDLPEPAETRNVNGGEGYSNQQVHVLALDVPPAISDPYKRVSGGTTIVEGLENSVEYPDLSYQYDIYQAIPEEDEKAYFSMFMMRDALPANILIDSVAVYADETDVSEYFDYRTTVDDEDPDNVSNTVMFTATQDYLAMPEAYGKLYDFRLNVRVAPTVQKPSTFLNNAVFTIRYSDSELEQNYPYGNTDTVSDGDPNTRTTNTVKTTFVPKVPVKKIWEDEDGYYDERPSSITIHFVGSDGSTIDKTLTAGENWEAVYTDLPGYTAGGDKITYTMYEDEIDMYDASNTSRNPLDVEYNQPNVLRNRYIPDYPVEKKVFNDDDEDIDGEIVMDGDTLHYTVYVTNPAQTAKKFDVEDVIPEHSTYIAGSANLGGVYDAAADKITWSNVTIPAGETKEFKFNVTAVGENESWVRIANIASTWMQRSDGTRNPNTEKQTNEVVNEVPPVYPSPQNRPSFKVVLDAEGNDINGKYVEKNDNLYYEITVFNGATTAKEYTITDVVPENTEFVEAKDGGTFSEGTVTWVKTIPAGQSAVVRFIAKATQDSSDIVNKALVSVDHVSWYTNEVTNCTAKILIDKTILHSYLSFGKQVFLYEIDGSNGTVDYRYIETGLTGKGNTSFVVPRYTPIDTTYDVHELRNARYAYETASTTTPDTTTVNTVTGYAHIVFSSGKRTGSVSYVNDIKNWMKASHAAAAINRVFHGN